MTTPGEKIPSGFPRKKEYNAAAYASTLQDRLRNFLYRDKKFTF